VIEVGVFFCVEGEGFFGGFDGEFVFINVCYGAVLAIEEAEGFVVAEENNAVVFGHFELDGIFVWGF